MGFEVLKLEKVLHNFSRHTPTTQYSKNRQARTGFSVNFLHLILADKQGIFRGLTKNKIFS